jgi:(2Fe-2S) ferredoxin
VAYADGAAERFLREPGFECVQLALRTAATQYAVIKRGNARRIIAAVLKPPERVDQLASDRPGS